MAVKPIPMPSAALVDAAQLAEPVWYTYFGSLSDTAASALALAASGLPATRAAAAASTIPAAVLFLQTGGYATAGDGGAARYKRATGTTKGGFQSVDGQWWALDERIVVPEMFGAKGDGASNDTAAMQDWLDAATFRFLPGKVYLVTASSGACLTWSNAGVIFGDRYASTIRAASGTPSSVDVLLVQPASNSYVTGWVARDFIVDLVIGGACRHAIVLSTPTVNQQIHNSLFHNLQIGSLVPGIGFDNGHAIHQLGDPSYGGLYTTTFSSLFINSGGVQLSTVGDSIMFRDCEINGYYSNTPFVGIDVGAVPGAGGPYIEDCNVTSVGTFATDAAGVRLTNCVAACLKGCEIEWNAAAGIANRMVVLNNCIATSIQGGFITANGTSTGCIRLMAGTTKTVVRDMQLAVGASGVIYSFDSGVIDNHFDHSCRYGVNGLITQTPLLGLSGSNNPNFGVFTSALALLSSWSAGTDASYRQGIFCTKMADGQVVLSGTITGGLIAGGTIFATLPIELAPTKKVRLPVPVFDGASWSSGVIGIDTFGNMSIVSAASNNILQFDHVSYAAL